MSNVADLTFFKRPNGNPVKVWLCEEREMVTDVKTVIGKKLKLDFAKKMELPIQGWI
jgi:ribosome maturation factor RimP